jgi:hypothetical protein
MTVADTIITALAWPAAVAFGIWLAVGFFLHVISH